MRPARREPQLPNHCYICNRSYSEDIFYLKHIYVTHGIDDESESQLTDAKPDINDPNNYYRICNKIFCTANSYRYHLLVRHSIKDERRKETSNSRQDISSPNSYCRTCNHKYKSKYTFQSRLCGIHEIKVLRVYDPNHCPDPHYCSIAEEKDISLAAA
ncbi:unnamed protein product [Mucor fragilis]